MQGCEGPFVSFSFFFFLLLSLSLIAALRVYRVVRVELARNSALLEKGLSPCGVHHYPLQYCILVYTATKTPRGSG